METTDGKNGKYFIIIILLRNENVIRIRPALSAMPRM